MRALHDLEASGDIRRMKSLGHQGTLIEVRTKVAGQMSADRT